MNKEQKAAVYALLGAFPDYILQGMSSAYCEGDWDAFKQDFAYSVPEVRDALEALIKYLGK